MKALILPFLQALLWVLERLPQKEQAAQAAPVSTAEPSSPRESQQWFSPVSRSQSAIEQHLERHWAIEAANARLQASGQGFGPPTVPRHKRDWDLVNRLKNQGLL